VATDVPCTLNEDLPIALPKNSGCWLALAVTRTAFGVVFVTVKTRVEVFQLLYSKVAFAVLSA